MARADIERLLANWIEQAQAPDGELDDGVAPAQWAAERFIAWWRGRAEDFLEEGEGAAGRLRVELEKTLNWEQHGEALHELIHVEDAFGDLRNALGFDKTLRED